MTTDFVSADSVPLIRSFSGNQQKNASERGKLLVREM
jgi:hypothetical protein